MQCFLLPLHCFRIQVSVSLEGMVAFSDEDKGVIKNDYEEKKWSAYRICKEHSTKNWEYSSVRRLLKKYKTFGSMERRPGSGRKRSVTTKENEELVERLICSQEENLAPICHLGKSRSTRE